MCVWFVWVWGLCKSIGQTNGKQSRGEKAKRRKRRKWEEKNGTYNPDTSLMHSQASPWSSALAEAAQRSLGLGNGIPIHTKTRPEGGRGEWGVGGGTKQGGENKGIHMIEKINKWREKQNDFLRWENQTDCEAEQWLTFDLYTNSLSLIRSIMQSSYLVLLIQG